MNYFKKFTAGILVASMSIMLIILPVYAGVLDANWTVQNTNYNIGNAGTNDYVAQRFVTILGGNIDKIEVYIKRQGLPTGNYSVGIYSDSGGAPNALLNDLELSDVSALNTSYAWIEFDLTGNEVAVDASTPYHIVIHYDGNSSNYMRWGADTLSEYTGGHSNFSSDGSSWTDDTEDMDFKIYVAETTGWSAGIVSGVDPLASVSGVEVGNIVSVSGVE